MSTVTPDLTPTQREMDGRDWDFGGTWQFESRWLFTDGIRIHYVDEGPRDGAPLVLLHTSPYWAYSFREEIPRLAADGRRAVAYDQLGFGRSDKPDREGEYSLERDVRHLRALLDELGFERVELFADGLAGAIARAFRADAPERVAALEERTAPPFPDLVRTPVLGRVLVKGARWPLRRAELSEDERAAYLAPHPSWASRSGIVASLRRPVE